MKKLLLLFPTVILLASCSEYSYFQSPFTSTANPYHAVPLQSDSLSGATYVNVSATVGSANVDWQDVVASFRASIHRANTFGNFHLHYGANVAVGTYTVSTSDFYDPNYTNTNHFVAGSKFFGGYGFNGGFSTLVPMKNGGEWRVIGLEGSAQNEFGDYLRFRKNLPDSSSTVNYKNSWMGTIGVTTEVISKRRKSGATFGYKLGIGVGLSSIKNYSNYTTYNPIYISNTIHFGKDNWLAFCQLNFGNYTGNFQFGVNYRIGAKKRE
ncbi:MAG: hypothetical protein JST75_06095 [Bacteroidetes bacterium]|nr:hypothetical protein [Bacteroidota bacterium]